MNIRNIDYNKYPKFRHNLWTKYEKNPGKTYLDISNGTYEVSSEEAEIFYKIRTFCTGHNSISDIAKKSNLPISKVESILFSLKEVGILHLPFKDLKELPKNEIIETLISATNLWSQQLNETHLSNDIFAGKTSFNILIGWLLETYYYVKIFPTTLNYAAKNANGELKQLLLKYISEEQGHEWFIQKTLINLGLTQCEIENSIPLISTKTINLLLKELFELEPFSVLLVAKIIESEEYNHDAAESVISALCVKHNIQKNALLPFFEHVKIDSELGHHNLLEDNIHLIPHLNLENLHDVVNKLHDIKHAFDLQKLEIKDYYERIGNYIPRQFVDYFAI